MHPDEDLRLNEIAAPWMERTDAGLVFIGVIRTPWATLAECPHYGSPDGLACRIEVGDPWAWALDGVEVFERIEVFYWLHLARRDLIRQSPGRDGTTKATFTIRSPVRPNPIGTSIVTLVEREGATYPLDEVLLATLTRAGPHSRRGWSSASVIRRVASPRPRAWGMSAIST